MKKLLTLTLLTIGLSGNALAEGVAFASEAPGATMPPRPEETMPPMETVR